VPLKLRGLRSQRVREQVVLLIYMISLLMGALDATIVNTALPSINRDFRTTLASTEWVVLGYLLSAAVSILGAGWLGDRFGTRRMFLAGLALFTAASALCGFAQALNQLIVFRIVQGLGAGLVAAVGQAMLYRTFAPERRARVAGLVAIGTSIGPILGPVLGGILVTELSWRWCFFVNLPIGAIALVIGFWFLQEHRQSAVEHFDASGFLLGVSGLTLFLYAVSEAPTLGWTNPTVIATGIAGLVALGALVLVELRQTHPMLNLKLFTNRIFRATLVVSFLSFTAYSGYLLLLPQFVQEVRGASALSSGFTTFPGAVGVLINSQVTARLYHRVGPRRMIVGGLCGVTIVFLCFSMAVGTSTSPWVIRLLAFCSGSSFAWCFIPAQVASFSTISSADMGRASALFTILQRGAGPAGVAIAATVVASSVHLGQSTRGASLVPAFHNAFLALAALMATAGLFALRIHDSDAAASMGRRVKPTAIEETDLAQAGPVAP